MRPACTSWGSSSIQIGVGVASHRRCSAELEPYARAQGAEKLQCMCKEDQPHSIRFLQHAGFTNFGLRFESILDLTTFDEHPFVGAIDRAQQAGFEFTTLAAERLINPEADRLLYELDHENGLEVPWPGGVRLDWTYEQWRQRTVDGPDADPSAMLIAKYHGQYAGSTSVEFAQEPARTYFHDRCAARLPSAGFSPGIETVVLPLDERTRLHRNHDPQ